MSISYEINDTFSAGGSGISGIAVSAYRRSRFISDPQQGDSPPGGPADATATTGTQYGSPGAVTMAVFTNEDYWLLYVFLGVNYWKLYTASLFAEGASTTSQTELAALIINGIPGAQIASMRWAGTTASGPPGSGTFLVNDVVLDIGTPALWIYNGSVWRRLSGGGGGGGANWTPPTIVSSTLVTADGMVNPDVDGPEILFPVSVTGPLAITLGSGLGTPDWGALTPVDSPPGLEQYAMAYDPVTDSIIVFGGVTASGPSSQTWQWKAGNWTLLTPTHHPSARSYSAMATDSTHGHIVLFGGNDGTDRDDTWIWSGTDWLIQSPVTVPQGRYSHVMADSPFDAGVVMFSGANTGGFLGDTCTWDGTDWTVSFPSPSPSDRISAVMAYDGDTGTQLLFGGVDSSLTYLSDTWTRTSGVWTNAAPTHHPSARAACAMDYDPTFTEFLLFGGSTGFSDVSETWAYYGGDWHEIFPASHPTARAYMSASYFPGDTALVLFSGIDNSDILNNDTWEYFATGGPPGDGTVMFCVNRSTYPITITPGTGTIVGGADYVLGPGESIDIAWSETETDWVPFASFGIGSGQTFTTPTTLPLTPITTTTTLDFATDSPGFFVTPSISGSYDITLESAPPNGTMFVAFVDSSISIIGYPMPDLVAGAGDTISQGANYTVSPATASWWIYNAADKDWKPVAVYSLNYQFDTLGGANIIAASPTLHTPGRPYISALKVTATGVQWTGDILGLNGGPYVLPSLFSADPTGTSWTARLLGFMGGAENFVRTIPKAAGGYILDNNNIIHGPMDVSSGVYGAAITLPFPFTSGVRDVAIAPDFSHAAVSTDTGSLGIFALPSWQPVGTVTGTAFYQAAFTPDSSKIWAADHGAGLIEIETATATATGRTVSGIGANWGVAIDSAGVNGWFIDINTGKLASFNLATLTIAQGFALAGGYTNTYLAISPDNRTALVTDYGAGKVFVIQLGTDAATGTTLANTLTLADALGPSFSADGSTGYVTQGGSTANVYPIPAPFTSMGSAIPFVGHLPFAVAMFSGVLTQDLASGNTGINGNLNVDSLTVGGLTPVANPYIAKLDYNGSPTATYTCSLTAMTALDITNLRVPVVVPPSGDFDVDIQFDVYSGSTGDLWVGVMNGASVIGQDYAGSVASGNLHRLPRIRIPVTGQTPGATINCDIAAAAATTALTIACGDGNFTGTNNGLFTVRVIPA